MAIVSMHFKLVSENYATLELKVDNKHGLSEYEIVKIIVEDVIAELRANDLLHVYQYDMKMMKIWFSGKNYATAEVVFTSGCWKAVVRIEIVEWKNAEVTWWIESAMEPQSL